MAKTLADFTTAVLCSCWARRPESHSGWFSRGTTSKSGNTSNRNIFGHFGGLKRFCCGSSLMSRSHSTSRVQCRVVSTKTMGEIGAYKIPVQNVRDKMATIMSTRLSREIIKWTQFGLLRKLVAWADGKLVEWNVFSSTEAWTAHCVRGSCLLVTPFFSMMIPIVDDQFQLSCWCVLFTNRADSVALAFSI